MNIEELLKSDLHVHRGGTLTWAVDKDVARFLHHVVSGDQTTLETGVGLSTVIFALCGSKHIAITPRQDEVDRIKEFCRDHAISTENVEFVVDSSDIALPKMDLPQLDLVLIDGGHGFPVPYIDWRYTATHLKVGGRMVIDDCQLETGAVLRNFLRQEEAWVEEHDFFWRTSVFKLKEPYELKDWTDQPYVRARSRHRQFLTGLRKAFSLIRRGDFGALYRGVKKWLNAQT
jgi:precorrin-6B methylase 2